MRYGFRIGFALALGFALMAGCSDENGEGGSGGTAGTGGMAGTGGIGGTAGSGGAGGIGGGAGGMPSDAVIPYDRSDLLWMSPFPDDNWLAPDASTPTGYRVSLSAPAREGDVQLLYSALMSETSSLDGFSPIGGVVIQLSAPPNTDSLPLTPQDSLEPSATVRLFHLTLQSETFGQRVPFQLTPISRALEGQEIDHSLVLYPSIPLTSKGRYALVVTKNARAEDGRRFAPSSFMTAVLGSEQPGEGVEITRARELLSDGVLDVLADDSAVSPPVLPSDIALVFRITIRSTDDIPLTPLSMKEQILSRPPPSYTITSQSPGGGYVSALVQGTWQAPNWRENQYFISRDANGDPQVTGSLSVDFVLALPEAAESGPVPIVMFQHGSPGSAEQVYSEALNGLAEAGFAVIGFTDTLNRELGQDRVAQETVLFQTLVTQLRFPHFPMQTYGDQMAFLRVIEQLGSLDRVPLPSGDGVPDLDVQTPLTYVGSSMGSIHGSAFLSYAPEIKAAALGAGAQRQAEQYFNGGTFIDNFPPALRAFLPNVTPTDYWVGLSIFQMIFDHQDAHHHAAHLYRDRIQVAGTTRKPSVLLAEGVGDTRVPNSLTRSLAWTFGPIPHLEPIWESTLILQPITGPVTANIDSETTAAFYQFVPASIPGIPPTPGCTSEPEGHVCALDAAEARLQRELFLRSAVEDPVPTITDPLSVAP
jgi:hypothetical protein